MKELSKEILIQMLHDTVGLVNTKDEIIRNLTAKLLEQEK